ncbi:EAL domain-containing protein [Citrobacter werkmanii]|uniref:EAL domain-containing protein n=1 Tax=Citrobacter werkmanii TaxID=67827 RepID=UPI0026542920|nr:EAL domain-containing protein [Citrobacter werkmanii]MDN8553971.1 EAL domain-containing protein [Citrobacter werkmanii]
MITSKKTKQPIHKWKIVPLITGVTFFCLLKLANVLAGEVQFDSTTIQLYDLTLPLISALLVLYRMRALPILGVLFLYFLLFEPMQSTLLLTSQLLAAIISQLIYSLRTGKLGSVSFGRSELTTKRIIWLVCCNSVLFLLLNHLLQANFVPASATEIFTSMKLINLQWIITSCITGIPFCYVLLRFCHKPKWGILYIHKIKASIKSGPIASYQIIWALSIIVIASLLIYQKQNTLIFSDYSLLWLLPVFVWGAFYISHALISSIWVVTLTILSNFVDGYIPLKNQSITDDNLHSLITSSTIILIYSLMIVVIGVLAEHNRNNFRQLTRISRSEPNTGLQNYYALFKDLKAHTTKLLCMVRATELDELEKIYGPEFRFKYVKELSFQIIKQLNCESEEQVYYTPGQGIIIRLDKNTNIIELYKVINNYRFKWECISLGINCGLAYTTDDKIIHNYSEIIKLLNINSLLSLSNGEPIAIDTVDIVDTLVPGDSIVSPGIIRNALQQAIDNKAFLLVAQPIVATVLTAQPIISIDGKTHYHEILTRLKTEDNKLIFPDIFLPLARNAGLLPALDLTVIEQTFEFMKSREGTDPNFSFSINLTPETLVQLSFLDNVLLMFKKYSISPNRIIFEVIESEIMDDDNVSYTLKGLRDIGSKIAIDDFGTGSSSYERLRNLNADILKIDGSFIKNIITDPFSHHAVKSFCDIAKLKNMEIVAEFVENEEIANMLTGMGVDWLQGYYIGKPVPVEVAKL